MGFAKAGISAIGKLAVVAALLAAFLGTAAGVVYMSLSGKEITVPEITGKDFFESEKELAALGLKIKRRADRPSTERINTVLEQAPKAGETVKSGQLIFVVVSKAGAEGDDAPKSLIKDLETDDTKTIEDMISDKPKKRPNSNSNTKKKADTTRDVNTDVSSPDADSDEKSNTKSADSDKKDTEQLKEPGEKGNKNTSVKPEPKQPAPPPKTKPTAGESRKRIQPGQ
ncbi:MAG: PASTA domain-containing protein [Acidobacteria bacterium]|nr:PASTA domain-containing protein [Acidobacteriota bacterium]